MEKLFYVLSNLDNAAPQLKILSVNDQTAALSNIESVISDVVKVWIRGEFQFRPDKGGLDQFQFVE